MESDRAGSGQWRVEGHLGGNGHLASLSAQWGKHSRTAGRTLPVAITPTGAHLHLTTVSLVAHVYEVCC